MNARTKAIAERIQANRLAFGKLKIGNTTKNNRITQTLSKRADRIKAGDNRWAKTFANRIIVATRIDAMNK